MVIKNFFKEHLKEILAIIAIIILITLKLISIKFIPDVFSDEACILEHLEGITKNLRDRDHNFLPFYSNVGAGYATYAYMYPMALILKFIGVSALKARIVQNLLTVLAVLFTAIGVKSWTKNKDLYWITIIIGLSLPWGFVQSSRVWDPAFVPLYFSLSFMFFSLTINEELNTFKKYLYPTLSFSFMTLLAVVYPPCRIPAFIMWCLCAVYLVVKKKITLKQCIAPVVASIVYALPLAINLLDKDFNSRSKYLVVYSKFPFWKATFQWAKNILGYYSPKQLFMTGDIIERHSLPIWGCLGTISIVPVVKIIRSKPSSLSVYMMLTILFTTISAGLTHEYDGQAFHALRSCLCWMPWAVLISLGWYYFLKDKSLRTRIIWYSIFTIFEIVFFISYVMFFTGHLHVDIY